VFLIGLVFAIAMYGPWRVVKPREDPLIHLWYTGWGVDFLYDKLFVSPFRFIVRALGPDFVDAIYNGIARLADLTSTALRRTQNGRVRWYAAGIAAGFIVLCAVVLLVRIIPGL
jgi:NADH-quinone oxidoreductase subunit L